MLLENQNKSELGDIGAQLIPSLRYRDSDKARHHYHKGLGPLTFLHWRCERKFHPSSPSTPKEEGAETKAPRVQLSRVGGNASITS